MGGGGARIGIGGMAVLLVLSLVFQRDLVTEFLGGGSTSAPAVAGDANGAIADPAEEDMVLFVSSVLDSAQVTWSRLLPNYPEARLVLFRDAVESACGFAQAATGPFYCPGDQRVYIDLGFFNQLDRQFGASGDFAQAYVLAHEIGHHVQTVTGTERKVRAAQQQDPRLANRLSVAMELQADCYAGVWAYTAARNGQLESGDLEEGLTAAAAVGDDRMQKMGGGRVNPESFTHGSSAERAQWFRRGFESGDPNRCDTFSQG
jgi:predicted metalloprotease